MPCKVQSGINFANRCQMLIVSNEKLMKRAIVLVLTESGTVSLMRELSIEAADEALPKKLNVILTSPRGDMIQLLVSKIEKEEAQVPLEAHPSIRKTESKSASHRIVEFKKFKERTKYALLGDYFCWTDEQKVMCQSLEAVEQKEIDLKDYFGDNAGVITIDGCMQKSLIEAGLLDAV